MKKKKKGIIREYLEAIVTALILALIIRTFVIQAFKIPSGSMKPTLLVGDHILVNKFIYGIRIPFTDKIIFPVREPKRGDVVVFEYPNDHSIDFIKRLIGKPGDKIQIINKQIYINGEKFNDKYGFFIDKNVYPYSLFDPRDNFGPIIVPQNSYFMLGDNRDLSRDSRYWGFVKRDEIIGKAFIIYWSWDKKANSLLKKIRFNRIGKLIR
jgi:signal peptidase I